MKYCKKCLEPNTRPKSKFDKSGLCLPCLTSEKVVSNDWKKRSKQLEKICNWAKLNTTKKYDCVIPVSGGKDSTRQALYMRDHLNMNPLLITMAYHRNNKLSEELIIWRILFHSVSTLIILVYLPKLGKTSLSFVL